MSIKRVLSNIGKVNLVPMIMNRQNGEDTLRKIGCKVVDQHDYNKQTMNEWTDLIDKGMEIGKPECKGKSFPWENASNYKSTEMQQAVRDFGDKAKMEIFSRPDLVGTNVTGKQIPEKLERAERVSTHMNYQVNNEVPYYREEYEKAVYSAAAQGHLFKKTFYDSSEGCNKSEWIMHPHFSIDNKAPNIEAGFFTHIRKYSENEIWERQQAKVWIDGEIVSSDDDDRDSPEYVFLEQFTFCDLDGDGYEEPYIVTVHRESQKVVRIAPRWDVEGIHVEYNGAAHNLQELIDQIESNAKKVENKEFNQSFRDTNVKKIEQSATLLRITPMKVVTDLKMVDPVDGGYLHYGYAHLLANLSKGINKGTNSLFNSADLSNLQGGWMSREHRTKKRGPFSMKPGKYNQTDIPARDLQNSIFPYPFKEPSQTLLAMTDGLRQEAKTLSNVINYDEMVQPNIPAASVLGVLQEAITPTSSLIKNIINAMTSEFKIMFNLNYKYTDAGTYRRILDEPQASYQDDYYKLDFDLMPTADANATSQMQRIQLATAQLEMIPMVLQAGGNPMPIVKYYFEALRSPIMDRVFPEEGTITPEEKQMIEQMTQQQQQANELAAQNLQMMSAQIEILNRDADRKDIEVQARIEKEREELNIKISETIGNLEKQLSEIVLNYEKAESEDAKTELETYKGLIEGTITDVERLKPQ